MIDSWKKQKSDHHHHNYEIRRTRSRNREPPLGSWQPTVPSWEKKFCTVVGSVPWRKILETKKFTHLYDNVLNWNDSAGKEAFHNAKNRFWAEMNGLPCDISLPDPDIYIDTIDWNLDVDPELLLDLDRDFVVPDGGEKTQQGVILGQHPLNHEDFSPTGWGNLEDDLKKTTDSSLENKANPWEDSCVEPTQAIPKTGGRHNLNTDSWCRSSACETMEDRNCTYCSNNSQGWDNKREDNHYGTTEFRNRNAELIWGTWDGRHGENVARQMSRFKTSRFFLGRTIEKIGSGGIGKGGRG